MPAHTFASRTPCLGDLFDGAYQVPRLWAFTITGDEFSWILPTLGLWFSSLITRDEQDRAWLNNGRPTCYWLTGFFNPQARKRTPEQAVSSHHGTKYPMHCTLTMFPLLCRTAGISFTVVAAGLYQRRGEDFSSQPGEGHLFASGAHLPASIFSAQTLEW